MFGFKTRDALCDSFIFEQATSQDQESSIIETLLSLGVEV